MRSHLVQQTNSMVLRHVVGIGRSQLSTTGSTKAKVEARRGFRGGSGFLCLALPSSHNILGDWEQVI